MVIFWCETDRQREREKRLRNDTERKNEKPTDKWTDRNKRQISAKEKDKVINVYCYGP